MRGSVKISYSSRLLVLNSDTTAPSGPGLEPVPGIRMHGVLLAGMQHNLVPDGVVQLASVRWQRLGILCRIPVHI